jgi:hypothetical protein
MLLFIRNFFSLLFTFCEYFFYISNLHALIGKLIFSLSKWHKFFTQDERKISSHAAAAVDCLVNFTKRK